MSGIEMGFLAPHPWIMVAGEREEGHHEITTSAFGFARDQIEAFGPDLIVVASPHWNPHPKFRIGGAARYTGSLDEFLPHVNAGLPPAHRRDLPAVPYDFPGNPDIAGRLFDAGARAGLPLKYEAQPEMLDHGSIVPIMYLNPEGRFPVILVSIEEGAPEESRKWGEIVGEEIARAGLRAVFVASGTLSHRFVFESPDALWPEGEVWDRKFMEMLTGEDPGDIFGLSDEYLATGELEDGGVHGLYMILGAMGREVSATVLSYEGVVGVGSPLIRFDPRRSGAESVTPLHTVRENLRVAEC